MAASHGKKTIITVATQDISAFTKTSSYEREADLHDLTGYGSDDRKHGGGVRTNKFTMSGTYDNTVSTGPRNVLHGVVGNTLALTRKIEGTATGKPLDTFNAVLTKYTETSPFDDYVSWAAEFTVDGAIVTTAQP